jgi:hypothetical protein
MDSGIRDGRVVVQDSERDSLRLANHQLGGN